MSSTCTCFESQGLSSGRQLYQVQVRHNTCLHVRYTLVRIMILVVYVSTTVFITQGNYIGYMFRLLNSHLQAYSLQVKSRDAVHTLGSLGVYVSEILKLKHFTDVNTLGSQCVHSIP